MRLIDADAIRMKAVPHTRGEYGYSANIRKWAVLVGDIDDAPTIAPESLRPQGEWIGEADGYADGELVYDVWYCSECNHCIDDGTDDPDLLPDFCPGCGAYMKGAGESEKP